MLVMRLSLIGYVLLCLVSSSLAARHFHANPGSVSTGAGLIGLLLLELIVLAALSLLLALVFALVGHGRLFGMIRFVSAWLFFICPVTLLMFSLTLWVSRPAGHSPAVVSGACLTMLIVAGLLTGTYVYARFVEPYRLQTTFYQVSSDKLAGLQRPVRIVLLADIQTDCITEYEKRVFSKALELKPDLILLVGDYLQCADLKSYHQQARLLQQTLKELNFTAPLGVFAVPGDCERYNGNNCFDGTAVQWLIDSSATINSAQAQISLTGLSWASGNLLKKCPPELLAGLDRSGFNIVLSHQPNFVLDLPTGHAVDLFLCGHTHGGQICLPFIGPLTTASRIPRSQAWGLQQINGTEICISRGIGIERGWAPRLRFLCRPQIVVIDLLAGQAS